MKKYEDMSIWRFSVERNIVTLQPEAELFEKKKEELNQERIRLAEIFCEKDHTNSPVFENVGDVKNYKMSSSGIAKFNAEFKIKLEEMEKYFNESLTDLVICTPSLKDLPDELLSKLPQLKNMVVTS